MPQMRAQLELGDAIAAVETHRMIELSKGMIQQVYNSSTYMLDIWTYVSFIVNHHQDEGVDIGPVLSWDYETNTVRCQPVRQRGVHAGNMFSDGDSSGAETFHLITGEKIET